MFLLFLQISQNLYIETVQGVPLFKGCSDEFLNQIVCNYLMDTDWIYGQLLLIWFDCEHYMQVMKLNEEFFLPGEVIIEQGSAVDQIYIVSHGELVMFYRNNSGHWLYLFMSNCAWITCRKRWWSEKMEQRSRLQTSFLMMYSARLQFYATSLNRTRSGFLNYANF